ncbi:integrin alpha-9-like [Styela clava]
MLGRTIVIAALFWKYASSYNIETTKTFSLYMRDGGASSRTTEKEPAYAGYTFNVRLEDENVRILVGQPRAGVVNQAISPGAIFLCNFTYVGEPLATTSLMAATESITTYGSSEFTTTTFETMGMTTVGTELTTGVPDFLSPTCTKLTIFDSTDRTQIGQDHKIQADALGLSIEKLKNSSDYVVCTPLRQKKCPGSGRTPGACYVGNEHGNWEFKVWNESKCFDKTIEIIFVVDGSRSIGVSNFELVKQWLINVTASLINDFGDAVRTEVLQFSNGDKPWSPVPIEESKKFVIPYALRDKVNIEKITELITDMPYLNSSTYTYYALRRTMEVEFSKSGYYDTSVKMVVVLTDGEANDGASLGGWHDKYKHMITPFAVGVGNYENFLNQLQNIANGGTGNERVLTVADFGALQGIIKDLTSVIKSEALEGRKGISEIGKDIDNAQVGASIASSMHGSLYIGGVGMYQGIGSIMKYGKSTDKDPYISPYSNVENVLKNSTEDTPYLGYATVTGFFDGINSTEYVATGAPRYKLEGAVIVYESVPGSTDWKDAVTILPPPVDKMHTGCYFGGVLLTVDVNGDDKDDLLVGSPLYIDQNYDEGRVFVYISQKASSSSSWASGSYIPTELYGDNLPGGRFGTAMTNAGDLNLDGYNDVIIGAPFAEDGRGAVFVYHGTEKGLRATYSQKILASSLFDSTIKYFGQSMQGNIDIDKNSYPDIFVGAPKSDSIVLLRSRPIVNIWATIHFQTTKLDIINCIKNNYTNCSSIEVCFTVNGTSIESEIGIEYNLTLDIAKTTESEKRLEFGSTSYSSGTGTTKLTKNTTLPVWETKCFMHAFDMRKNISDYESTLVAEIEYDLLSSHVATSMSSVKDPLRTYKKSSGMVFMKQCGEEDICNHDLRVGVEMNLPSFHIDGKDYSENGQILIIDSSTTAQAITVRVNFTNVGENAFGTKLNVSYSSKISLSTIFNSISYPELPSCVVEYGIPIHAEDGFTTKTFKYNSQENIMIPEAWCYFEFNIIASSLKRTGNMDAFIINITTYASLNSSTENNTLDNSWEKSPAIKYRSDFNLRRESSNPEISFNYTTTTKNITTVDEISEGISVIEMSFRITGAGYSNIPSSQISLTWPSKYAGAPLLYLYQVSCNSEFAAGVDNPTTCICEQSNINSYDLVIDTETDNSTKGYATLSPPDVAINVSEMNCKDFGPGHSCDSLICNVANIGESDKINFYAKFRLWTSSITFEGTNQTQVDLQTLFEISTTGSPLIINSEGRNVTIKTEKITTVVKKYIAIEIPEQQNVIWYYIVAAAGGVLLLIPIVLLLWKCGFFRSKYAEKQKTEEDKLADETDFPDVDAGKEFTMGSNFNGVNGSGLNSPDSAAYENRNFIDATLSVDPSPRKESPLDQVSIGSEKA